MVLWNFTIDDTSPFLAYAPFSDGDILVGWETWYTRSGFSTNASDGDSFHVTSSSGSRVSLQFFGTGLQLYGISNSPFDVTIDNNNTPSLESSSSLLYSVSNLVEDLHYVTVFPRASNSTQQFGLDFVTVSTPLPDDENPLLPVIIEPDDGKIQRQGSWASTNGTLQTTDQGASVSWNFSGARAVSIKGATGLTGSQYSVSLNGVTSNYNATSIRSIPETVLFFQGGLNPTLNYTLDISNLVGGKALTLTSLAAFLQQPKNATTGHAAAAGGQPKTLNAGLIFGPVLGVLVSCFLIAFFWQWYRRRRGKQRYIRDHMPDKLTLTFQPSTADTRGPPPPPRPFRPANDIFNETPNEKLPLPTSPSKPSDFADPSTPLSPQTFPGTPESSSSGHRLPSYHAGDTPYSSPSKKSTLKIPITSPPRTVKPLPPPPPMPAGVVSPPMSSVSLPVSVQSSTTSPTRTGPIRKLPIPPGFPPDMVARLQGQESEKDQVPQASRSAGENSILPLYQP